MGLNSDFWRERRVFVTGATGLLGGWMVSRLVAQGADVVCLVRDWVPRSELALSGLIERITAVRGDVRSYPVVERVISEYEIDTVFHLAAQTIVGIANRNPLATFETNIQGTWNVLEACRRTGGVSSIVLASSDKAYGDDSGVPYTETTPLCGRHPYDVTKSCADLLAQAYAHTYRLRVGITRCGNLFGGGDLNWNRLVPGTIRSILRGEQPILRSDGRSIRDYIYVEDAVLAYLLLARVLSTGEQEGGTAFNFSNESRLTSLDVVSVILRLMKSDMQPRILDSATNEIHRQTLDASRARHVLGWRSAFTLEEGLARTIDWYSAHLTGRQFVAAAEPSIDEPLHQPIPTALASGQT